MRITKLLIQGKTNFPIICHIGTNKLDAASLADRFSDVVPVYLVV